MTAGFALGAIALAAIVLVMLLRPLWRDARSTAIVLALALPLIAGGLYLLIGTPAALAPQAEAPATLDDAVAALEARLAEDPADIEGWLLLARTRKAQQQFEAARAAYARADTLMPDQPSLMVEYAEAITLAGPDRRIGSEARTLLERALEIDPQHQRALWFLGIERFQNERWTAAAALWERLLPLVSADTRATLLAQIDEARGRAGLPPIEAAPQAEPVLTVAIELAPELRSRLDDGDVLYVFARQPDGPAMPLAVKRLPATGFPVEVALTDADSPMPALKLSEQAKVRLIARISKSGDAGARPGDLESTPLDVELSPGAGYALRIDRVVE